MFLIYIILFNVKLFKHIFKCYSKLFKIIFGNQIIFHGIPEVLFGLVPLSKKQETPYIFK